MVDKVLPPLPPSDFDSMRVNHGARDFWGYNEVIQIEDKPMKKCEHKFKMTPTGVECSKCHFGLIAKTLEVRDGKLYFKGEPIGL